MSTLREEFEAWRGVPDFAGLYEVSNMARIRNLRNGRFLAGTRYSTGYFVVCLSSGGVVTRRSVHRVVASAWLGPAPHGHQVDHIDGVRTNNVLSNLRYLTPKENIRATVDRGANAFGERNGQSRLTYAQVETIRQAASSGGRFWGPKKYAEDFGVSLSCVRRAASGYTYCAAAIRGDAASTGRVEGGEGA